MQRPKANKEDIEEVVEEEKESKIVLIGDGNAGKTALVNRISKKGFDKNSSATIGQEIYSTNYQTIQKDNLKLSWWDVGGQKGIEASVARQTLTGASVVLLCVDINDSDWQKNNEERLTKYKRQLKNTPVYLVVTKTDSVENLEAQKATIEEFAQKQMIQKIFYTSAKETENQELKDLEDCIVYTCLKMHQIDPAPFMEDTSHNTPPRPQEIVVQPRKEEAKIILSQGQQTKEKSQLTQTEIDKVANLIFSKSPLTRKGIIDQINDSNQTHPMNVIDKLKILEKVFEKIKNQVEEKPDPDKKDFRFKSLNLKYTNAELEQIATLKKLYIDYIRAEPWSTRNKSGTVEENPLNGAIKAHTDEQNKPESLIDFQQTQFKLFKTKTTTTRKLVNSLVEGAGRQNESFAALMCKYHPGVNK